MRARLAELLSIVRIRIADFRAQISESQKCTCTVGSAYVYIRVCREPEKLDLTCGPAPFEPPLFYDA